MRQPSVMPPQKNFNAVPRISGQQRSVFNRSHGHKLTMDAGFIVPFYVDEIIPGDSQELTANLVGRLSSPLIHPIMDNLHIDTFFFFVPNRLVWDNWEKFMGAQDDPDDSIDFTIPTLDTELSGGFSVETIGDYFGLPTGVPDTTNNMGISALYHRAYNLIYNEWFRDENLQNSQPVPKDDGPDSLTNYALQRRPKRHDYFTSCLPFAQKGDPVGIGLTGVVGVRGTGDTLGLLDGSGDTAGIYIDASSGSGRGLSASISLDGAAIGDALGTPSGLDQGTAIGVDTDATNSGMEVDLSTASAILINDLRTAVAMQHVLEADARGGTRYVELIKNHFGVISPDFRLQRPEYLGGSTNYVTVNAVTQTSQSNDSDEKYQGEQAAFGTIQSRSGYSKSFVEHGMVFGFCHVRADLTYQQGIPKMFNRSTRFDFYLPLLANLGEQEVLNREIYWADDDEVDDEVFGYQERWAEMRYKPSGISGYFRSNATNTLDSWHLSEDFADTPVLGDAFLIESPPLDRVLTIVGNDTPEIIMDCWIDLKHARPMPVYSVPGLERL